MAAGYRLFNSTAFKSGRRPPRYALEAQNVVRRLRLPLLRQWTTANNNLVLPDGGKPRLFVLKQPGSAIIQGAAEAAKALRTGK